LHQALGVPLFPGLAEVLSGKASLETVVLRTRVPDLSLVPAGEVSASAQVLLSGPAMKGFLAGMRERFDLVILDTPPILQYPDALYVAKDVDGIVQVIAARASSRKDQQELRRLLEMVGARTLGAVLNRVPSQEATPTTRVP
jgi:Mrp family chromosome partitioning ATPase